MVKKICFQILSLNASGGAEKVLSNLASALDERGYEVSIVCLPREGRTVFYPISAGVSVHYLEGWDDEPGLAKYSKKIRNARRERLLCKKLKEIGPDISISFLTDMTIYAASAAKRAKIPHISCERNSPWDKPEKTDKRERRDQAFAISTGCVVQTEAIRQYFPKDIQQKTIVIPNPITLTCEPRTEDIQCDNRVVSIGRIATQKNQILLIRAFYKLHQRHPEYKLEIYGKDFGCQSSLETMIESLDLEGCVAIREPIYNVHSNIRQAKMFVMTSNYEGYPNALAEAVALGIPSISTDCRSKGPAEILLNGQRGVLVPINDCESLVKAMCAIAEDTLLAQRFSAEGIAFGKSQTLETYADAWEHAINKVFALK